ncbi:MAG: hypothetical protein J5965_02355 [Aeriscardovia sp.]|nr:hypothetical protein [Aeriscardovia sp.]
MCLRTRQICPLRARKDIICYKAFIDAFDNPNYMGTLYIAQYIKKPTKAPFTLMDDTNTPLSILRCNYSKVTKGARYQIWGGMIHAFKTMSISKKDYFRIVYKASVYKCIIPKGTLYYVGMDGDICAKKMLVIEKVNPNTAG